MLIVLVAETMEENLGALPDYHTLTQRPIVLHPRGGPRFEGRRLTDKHVQDEIKSTENSQCLHVNSREGSCMNTVLRLGYAQTYRRSS